jgi:hypothetical protein
MNMDIGISGHQIECSCEDSRYEDGNPDKDRTGPS